MARITKASKPGFGINDVLPCDDPSCHDRDESWLAWFRKKEPNLIPPPDRSEIGRASWLLVHTAAAKYPTCPSEEERRRMGAWLRSFAYLYPCHICRIGFIKVVNDLPPDTQGRDSLSMWTCSAHNRVNADIGLPEYPCNLANLLSHFGKKVQTWFSDS